MSWQGPFRESTSNSWNRLISRSAAAIICLSTPASGPVFQFKSKQKMICYGSATNFSPTSSHSNDLSFMAIRP